MPNANVDERIVEMRIDSAKFEAGAKRTIQILEDLDDSLDSVSKVNNSGFEQLADTLDIVQKRFSAMGIIGDQILRNLTNKAMDLIGRMTRLGRSMTIDQVGAGWSQYESKTRAVQTIMAATASEFEDQVQQMEVVNAQLEKLLWFTDETSYSFLDMTSNIGKFTSNGMGLEESVTAMEGISTWAAISGAGIQEASRAMYNLSQALATGSVKLIDWKSIENANMATREFKQTALETAVALGTLTKTEDGLYRTMAGHTFSIEQFNTQLSDGWFSSDVLMKVLNNYGQFTDILSEACAAAEELGHAMTATQMLKALDDYKSGNLEKGLEDLIPWLQKLSDTELELGERAFKAAQEAKTFSEALDATRDAVKTKWNTIFEKMFGDYLSAKVFWTDVSEQLYNIFADPLNTVYDIVEKAFDTSEEEALTLESALAKTGRTLGDFEKAFRRINNSKFDEILQSYDSLDDAIKRGAISSDLFKKVLEELSGQTEGELAGTAKSVAERIEEMRQVATAVMRGDYSAGEERRKMLEELGYNYDMIQFIADTMIGEPWTDTETILERYHPEYLVELAKAAGYTEEQIAEMTAMVENSDEVLKQLIENATDSRNSLERMSGRSLLTGGIINILTTIAKLTGVVKDGFVALLGGEGGIAKGIHRALENFYAFTNALTLTDDQVESLTETVKAFFRGVRVVIGTITGFVKTVLSTAFDLIKKIISIMKSSGIISSFGRALLMIFGALLTPIILIGQYIGELINRFKSKVGNRWVERLTAAFTKLAAKIEVTAVKIKNFFESSKTAAWIRARLDDIVALFMRLKERIEAIGNPLEKLGNKISYVFLRAKTGYKNNGIAGMFKGIISSIRYLLRDNTKLRGFFTSISGMFGKVGSAASKSYTAVIDWFKNFSWENFKNNLPTFKEIIDFVIKMVQSVISKIVDVIKSIDLEPLRETFNKIFENLKIGEAFAAFIERIRKFFSSTIKIQIFSPQFFSNIWDFIDIFRSLALVISSSMLMSGLGKFFWNLGSTLNDFARVANRIAKSKQMFALADVIRSIGFALIALAASVAIIAGSIWLLSKIPNEDIRKGLTTLTIILVEIAAIMIGFKVGGISLDQGINGILQFAVGLFLIGLTLTILSRIPWLNLAKGLIGAFGCMEILALMARSLGKIKSRSFKEVSGLIACALSIYILAIALKKFAKMSWPEIIQGLTAMFVVVILLNTIIWSFGATKGSKQGIGGLIGVAAGLYILARTIKYLSRMDFASMLKGLIYLHLIIGAMNRIIKAVGKASRKAKGNIGNFASIIAIALSCFVLAMTVRYLSDMPLTGILKGVLGLYAIVISLSTLLIGVAIASRLAKKSGVLGLFQIITIAGLLVLFAVVAKQLGALDTATILKGLLGLSLIVNQIVKLMFGLFIASKIAKSGVKSVIGSLLLLGGVAGTVYVVAQSFLVLANIPSSTLMAASVSIMLIMGSIKRMLKTLGKVSNSLGNIKTVISLLFAIISVIAVLGAVVFALTLLSEIKASSMFKAVIGIILGLMAISSFLKKLQKRMKKGLDGRAALIALIGVALVIATLVGALMMLSDIRSTSLFKAVGILIIGFIGISGLLRSLSKLTLGKQTYFIIFAGIVATLIAITFALQTLSNIGPERLIPAAIALLVGLLAISGMMYVISKTVSPDWQTIIASIIMLGAVVVALAKLDQYDPDHLIKSAIAVVIGIVGLTGAMLILSKVKKGIKAKTFLQLFGAILLLGSLAAVIAIFSDKVKDVGKAAAMAGILVATLLGLVAVFAIMGLLGHVIASGAGLFLVSVIVIMASIVVVILAAWGIAEIINAASSSFNKLAENLKSFVQKLNDIPVGGETVGKVAMLMAVLVIFCAVDILTAIAAGLAGLANVVNEKCGDSITTLITSLEGGINALNNMALDSSTVEKAANLVLVLAAICVADVLSIVASVLSSIASIISGNLGWNLTKLILTLLPFMGLVQLIPEGALGGARRFGRVMGAIAEISAFEVLAAACQWIASLFSENVGTHLAGIASGINEFLGEAGQINSTHVTNSKNFAEVMKNLALTQVWEDVASIASKIGDVLGSDGWMETMTDIAKKVPRLLHYVKKLSADDVTSIANFASIMKEIAIADVWATISEVLQTITNKLGSDGFMETLGDIADKVPTLAEKAANIPEGSDANIAKLTAVLFEITKSNFWSTLSTALNALGQALGGDAFMDNLTALAEKVPDLADACKDIPDKADDKVKTLTDVLKAIVGAEVWGGIAGIFDTLDPSYAERLSTYITNLQPFLTAVSQIDNSILTNIGTFESVLKEFVHLNFWNSLAGWANRLSSKAQDASDLNTAVQNLIANLRPLLYLSEQMDPTAVQNFANLADGMANIISSRALTEFPQTLAGGMDALVDAFEQSEGELLPKVELFGTLYQALADFTNYVYMISGLEFNADEFKAKLKSIVSSIVMDEDVIKDIRTSSREVGRKIIDGANDGLAEAKDRLIVGLGLLISDVCGVSAQSNILEVRSRSNKIGQDLVDGIVDGIAEAEHRLIGAINMLVEDIYNAFRSNKKFDSNSPAKAYAVLGGYLDAGLAQGINENSGIAEDSLITLGDSMYAAMQEAMMHVAMVADDQYEFHPMITPVVDMSNVDAASNAVSGAFGGSYAVSAQMNDAIRRRMSDLEFLAGAMSGGGQTINGDNITVNVYPAAGQDPEAIADAVLNRINERSIRRGVAFG